MRKEEFLTALRAGLTGLLPEGVEKLLEFCREMVDDLWGSDGMGFIRVLTQIIQKE